MLIHSSAGGFQAFLHFLVLVNHAAGNLGVQIHWRVPAFSSLGSEP